MSFFNQYSFVLAAAVVIGFIAALLFRDGVKRNDWLALGAVIGAFVVAWFILRPTPSNLTINQIDTLLKSGQPVLIEFQSEY